MTSDQLPRISARAYVDTRGSDEEYLQIHVELQVALPNGDVVATDPSDIEMGGPRTGPDRGWLGGTVESAKRMIRTELAAEEACWQDLASLLAAKGVPTATSDLRENLRVVLDPAVIAELG